MIDLLQQPNHSGELIYLKTLIGIDIIPTLFMIVANSILLLTIAKTKSLHTPSNALLSALCFSDLLVGAISQPLFLAFLSTMLSLQEWNRKLYAAWIWLATMFNGTSFIMVLNITIERYIAVCYPFFYERKASIKLCIVVVALTWMYQVLAPILAGSFYILLFAIFTIISFIINVFCYLRIYLVIIQKERSVLRLGEIGDEEREILHRNREERSKAYTIMILLIVFTITYLPSLIVLLALFRPGQRTSICGSPPNIFLTFASSSSIYASSAAINPIVYCIRIKPIRAAIKNLFKSRNSRVVPM